MKTEPGDRPTVHLAASGGGHLELLVFLEDVLRGYERVWVVSPGLQASRLSRSGASVHEIPNPGRSLSKVWSNLSATVAALARDRPRIVVTTGAGSVVPYVALAWLIGARVVFIETTARITNPSKSGRVLSRIASFVIVQWPEMQNVYPGSVVCRPMFWDRARTSRVPGKGTFVAVGTHSDPFNRLLELVDDAVGEGLLPGPVVAQAGASTYRPRHYESSAWLSPEELQLAIHGARYVVCHAGSGIISLALAAGRRPLVVPRRKQHGEHFDDHQTQLAERLDELGLVVRIESALTAEHVHSSAGGFLVAGRADLPSVMETLNAAVADVQKLVPRSHQQGHIATRPAWLRYGGKKIGD